MAYGSHISQINLQNFLLIYVAKVASPRLKSLTNEPQTLRTYLPSETLGMKEYLSPDGKPAPPRPLKPDFLISSMIQSGPIEIMSLVWCQSPRLRAPSSQGLPSLYRLVKMRS